MQSQPRSTLLPLAAAGISLSVAALLFLGRRKIRLESSLVRKAEQTSHIHIQTANGQLSCEFFLAFGLVEISSNGPFILLACPSRKIHQPYILLEEIPPSEHPTSSRKDASDVGIGYLCLGVKDVYMMVEHLNDNFLMYPIEDPVCDRSRASTRTRNSDREVTVAAYRDPASGAVVELASLPYLAAKSSVKTARLSDLPVFVHANVNVSNYKRGLASYQALGFAEILKQNGPINKTLYKALGIADPGIAKQVTSIKTKNEKTFSIEVIEWEDHDSSQRSVSSGELQEAMRLALTVQDLPNRLDRIFAFKASDTKPNWTLVGAPRLKELPAPLGKAIVATIKDRDDVEVDLVEYTLTPINVSLPTELEKNVILITGCDSGFGRSLACQMSLLGFSVVAACFTKAGAEYMSQVAATVVVADLATQEGIKSVVEAVRDNLEGRQLWAIVNNAATCYPGNVEWQRPDLYQKAMQVNFHAPVSIIHALIQNLKSCPGSRILQVSSVMAMLPLPSSSAYCSTKGALEAYSDCLRCELRPYDCHVTVVQPGPMKTDVGLLYWDRWYEGFKEAPKDRQTSFQKDQLEGFVAGRSQQMQEAAEDPDLATKAMVKALLEPQPPTRLRVGLSAELFYRPVSCLPDRTRDSILWNFMQFDKARGPLEGNQ